MSHIVKRDPDAYARQDASSSWGVGGYCANLNFWWQVKWEEFEDKVKESFRTRAVSINVGKLAAIVINYAAMVVAFTLRTMLPFQPKFLCGGDNTTADAWYYKFSNPCPEARRLTKILSFLMKHCDIRMDVEHVAGLLNYFADAISRGKPKYTLESKFKRKCPNNRDALNCLQVQSTTAKLTLNRFHPAPEILHDITSALLQKNTTFQTSANPMNWGHFAQDNNISFDFLGSWTWTCH